MFVCRSHSLKLLSTILEVDTSNPSILEVDMFSLLVCLTYSLPSLFNGEGTDFHLAASIGTEV
jgi:hypothetical protein